MNESIIEIQENQETELIETREQFPEAVHITADFEYPKIIEDPKQIRKILYAAAKAANNTPLKTAIYKFPIQGITAVILLAESHISLHTWPEYNYMAVDIFTCGKQTQPIKALEYLRSVFCPKRIRVKEIKRGV